MNIKVWNAKKLSYLFFQYLMYKIVFIKNNK